MLAPVCLYKKAKSNKPGSVREGWIFGIWNLGFLEFRISNFAFGIWNFP